MKELDKVELIRVALPAIDMAPLFQMSNFLPFLPSSGAQSALAAG